MHITLPHMQAHLAEALRVKMDYVRKPEGAKRGNGAKRPEKAKENFKKFSPTFPASPGSPIEDRPAHERHLKKLKQECKHSRPNQRVS